MYGIHVVKFGDLSCNIYIAYHVSRKMPHVLEIYEIPSVDFVDLLRTSMMMVPEIHEMARVRGVIATLYSSVVGIHQETIADDNRCCFDASRM